jgi:outer membrane lipoprotein SlyB
MKTSIALLGLIIVLIIPSHTMSRAPDGAELPVPVNTKVSLQLLSTISTATNKKGDKFSCKVLTPAEYEGAIVEGHIRNLKRSGRADKDSKIDLAFDTITLPDARVGDFSATVLEVFDVVNAGDQGRADNEGTVRSKSTTVRTSIKRAAAGALIGAVIGGVVAGGQGAAVGAAIGASIGATTTLASKGSDLEFKDGTQFTVECNGPRKKPQAVSSNAEASFSTPGLPSPNYRLYRNNREFNLSVPDNWRDITTTNGVSFAPSGGYANYHGKPNLTHGVIIGLLRSQVVDLRKASEQLVGALLKSNSNFQQRGDYMVSTIGGRGALIATVSGTGSVTNRLELVKVHTVAMPNGNLFFLLTVVPDDEQNTYRETFDHVLASVSFTN